MSNENKHPWEKVTVPSYFRKVLGNMGKYGFGRSNLNAPCLRFGNTGGGHSPNYQIEKSDGSKYCFKGMNHDLATEAGGEFESKNLSDKQFSYRDVQEMLAEVIS